MEAQSLDPASLARQAVMNRRAVTAIPEGQAQGPRPSTACKRTYALGETVDQPTGDAPQVAIAPRLHEFPSQYDPDEQERLAVAILNLPRVPGPVR